MFGSALHHLVLLAMLVVALELRTAAGAATDATTKLKCAVSASEISTKMALDSLKVENGSTECTAGDPCQFTVTTEGQFKVLSYKCGPCAAASSGSKCDSCNTTSTCIMEEIKQKVKGLKSCKLYSGEKDKINATAEDKMIYCADSCQRSAYEETSKAMLYIGCAKQCSELKKGNCTNCDVDTDRKDCVAETKKTPCLKFDDLKSDVSKAGEATCDDKQKCEQLAYTHDSKEKLYIGCQCNATEEAGKKKSKCGPCTPEAKKCKETAPTVQEAKADVKTDAKKGSNRLAFPSWLLCLASTMSVALLSSLRRSGC